MKHSLLYVLLLACILSLTAQAQRVVDLSYYQPDPTTIMRLNLPYGAMAITRFETESPAKIMKISFWPVADADRGDSVNIYLFGREGGGAYPYLLQPFFATKVYIPAATNAPVEFNFQEPYPNIPIPSIFFMGVQTIGSNPGGPGVQLRMDLTTQTPRCATNEKDTMYTSSFWQPLQPPYLPFGAMLVGNVAINNWYMSAKVEYDESQQNTMFEDVTQSAKVNGMPGTKKQLRVAAADFNADGFQDLLWGDRLYKNKGDGTFEDVAKAAGYSGGSSVNMFVDVDNDGDLDIACQPDNWIYLNNGAGVFTRDDQPGFVASFNTQCMAWTDYDNDMFPDVFVGNSEYKYVKNPANPNDSALVEGAAPEAFFYANLQNGKFRDVKSTVLGGYRSGQYGTNPYTQARVVGYRPATAAEWCDTDNDSDLDLFVANDRLQPNSWFENQGNGFFKEGSTSKGLAGGTKSDPNYTGLYGNTRGCDFGDYNNDGYYDLVTSEIAEANRLGAGDFNSIWKSNGKPSYSYSLVPNNTTTKFPFNIYSGDVRWGDFNNDGLLDVVFTSGPSCAKTQLFMQNPDRSFTDVTYAAGVGFENTLGVAWVDYDNDGSLDLVTVSESGLRLYKNYVSQQGNWIAFKLKGKTCNNFAIGTRVKVTVGTVTYTKYVTAGKGSGSQDPYLLHFGVGSASAVDQVIVKWPGGNSDTLKTPEINKINSVVEFVKDPSPADDVPNPQALTLQQNYPNPFSRSASPSTSIAYNLPSTSDVKIEIFDMNGSKIKTLVSKVQTAGTYFVQWNGRDDASVLVPSGSYQYVLSTNGVTMTKRLIVLK